MPLLEILYDALRAEVGVIVRTDDVGHLRQKLYQLQKEEEELEQLSFVVSPTDPNSELWVIKNARASEAA